MHFLKGERVPKYRLNLKTGMGTPQFFRLIDTTAIQLCVEKKLSKCSVLQICENEKNVVNIVNITWRREDMNFIFEW